MGLKFGLDGTGVTRVSGLHPLCRRPRSGGPLANFLAAAVLLAIGGHVPALLAGANLFLGVGNLVWPQAGRDGYRIAESLRAWQLLRKGGTAA